MRFQRGCLPFKQRRRQEVVLNSLVLLVAGALERKHQHATRLSTLNSIWIYQLLFHVPRKKIKGSFGVAGKVECGVRSAECGVRSAECGVRSPESGVRSPECGVRSAHYGKTKRIEKLSNLTCHHPVQDLEASGGGYFLISAI